MARLNYTVHIAGRFKRDASGFHITPEQRLYLMAAPLALTGLEERATHLEQALALVFFMLNPWTLAATALIFGGELIYNYWHRTPLQRWSEQCAWGNDPRHWDYRAQQVHWQEVRNAPQLQVEVEHYTVPNPPSAPLDRLRLKTLRLVAPMAAPRRLRLAGCSRHGDTVSDITRKLLAAARARIRFDGMNTVYEYDWSHTPNLPGPIQALDLMLEVTTPQGQVLFAAQGGARFSLDPLDLSGLDAIAGHSGWYTVEPLEQEDEQLRAPEQIKAALQPLETPAAKAAQGDKR